MSLFAFFLGVLVAYGGLQVYFARKLEAAFPGARRVHWAVGAFLVLMIWGPFLLRALDRFDVVGAARPFGAITYLWCALVLWFATYAVAADLWNLLVRIAAAAFPAASCLHVSPRRAFVAVAALVGLSTVWGFLEAESLRVREIHLPNPYFDPGASALRIVQISDVHLSPYTLRHRVRQLVDRIREINPDLIVSTGDLVDPGIARERAYAGLWEGLRPPLGKYAVLGNHEFYTGLDAALSFHREAGFRLLREQAARVTPALTLAGVDDPAGGYMGAVSLAREARALDPAPGDSFVVLLKHQPVVDPRSLGCFDLQLSGHTHGGQIFPFGLAIRFLYPFESGLHALGKRSLLYVTRGAGTWGPPLRFLAPPEITLIVLTPPAR